MIRNRKKKRINWIYKKLEQNLIFNKNFIVYKKPFKIKFDLKMRNNSNRIKLLDFYLISMLISLIQLFLNKTQKREKFEIFRQVV